MAYVPVPKDLTKVETKVMFNLTRRQLVCFTAGALVGVPLFLWLREPAGNSMAAMCMMLVMMPFFLLAMYSQLSAHTTNALQNAKRVEQYHLQNGSSKPFGIAVNPFTDIYQLVESLL